MEALNNTSPFITIAIVTYNSESTILETLESVKNQTCRDFELIISDDGSKDKTVEICRQWLNLNAHLFANVLVLTVNANTGTSFNCNRALKSSNGEWLMLLAGDDALMPDAINLFEEYILKVPEAQWIATRYDAYDEKFNDESKIIDTHLFDKSIKWGDDTPSNQLLYLVKKGCPISASSFYFKRNIIIKYGGFNERYKFIEDVPMMITLLENGVKCFFYNKSTVKYRKQLKSSSRIYNMAMVKERREIAINMRFKYLNFVEKTNIVVKYNCLLFLNTIGLNRNTPFCRFVYYVTMKLINVLTWKHGGYPYAYSK